MWKNAEEFLLKDEYIGPLVLKYGSCSIKPRGKEYYFEDLLDSIVQQQLSMRAAAKIFERIKEKIYDKVGFKKTKKHKWREAKTLNVKITPEKILSLPDKELRSCGLSKAKIYYIKCLSEMVLSNKLEIRKLDRLSDEEVMQELLKIKGIGIWTSKMFLMFTLARPDIFPIEDLGLRNAFKKIIGKDLNRSEMEIFSLRWKPYRTIASWYLWRSLEST